MYGRKRHGKFPWMAPLLALLFLSPTTALAAPEANGRVFYEELSPARPSFLFRGTEKEAGGRLTATTTYSDLSGKALASEESEIASGRLLRYSYKQLQVSEHGEAEVRDGKLWMSFTDETGTRKGSESDDPRLIVSSMIGPLLRKNWEALMSGDTLHTRYLVVERLETIGFKFFKDGERVFRGRPVVDILMKPSSIFIAMLVKPARLTMLKESPHWLVETEGRTPIRVPKQKPPRKRGDWMAIDARVEYDIPAESAKSRGPNPGKSRAKGALKKIKSI